MTDSDAVFGNFLQIIFIRVLSEISVTQCHPSPGLIRPLLMEPFPSDLMDANEVSRLVNDLCCLLAIGAVSKF